MSDNTLGIIIFLAIIAIIAFGGNRNAQYVSTTPTATTTTQATEESKKIELENKIEETRKEIEVLQKQAKEKEDAKTYSVYRGKVKINYVSRSTTAASEYAVLTMDPYSTTTINITGWTLKSLSTGSSVTIPKGTYLIFANSLNTEDPIVLTAKDTVYIVTGSSPNGYSFKLNKCSGYMSQFQTFTPYISTQCPAPRNEDLSSIPNRVINDACFDYIESFPTCRVQTDPLPQSYSSECRKFITEKINYKTCVDVHKNDSDFYLADWRVYLKRSEPLWKSRREQIVLLDTQGKIVDTLTY